MTTWCVWCETDRGELVDLEIYTDFFGTEFLSCPSCGHQEYPSDFPEEDDS